MLRRIKRHIKLFLLKRNSIGLHLGNSIEISRSVIGKYVFIGDNTKVTDSHIGDFSYANFGCIINNVQIGKFCSIGPNVKMGLGNHPSSGFVSTSPYFYSGIKGNILPFADKSYFKEHSKIYIGNDVWIGANVIITDGVNIGNGAIIAAGSVVVKDVPDYSIFGGVPAKEIRKRFDEKQIELLQKSKWWENDEKWLRANFEILHNIDSYIKFIENE